MNDYQSITLKAGACELELVPEFGGITNKLILAKPGQAPFNVMAGLGDKQQMQNDQGYHGIPLFPVVNRLDKGQYRFNGQSHQLTINETTLNNTLHGFIHHLTPSVKNLQQGDEQSSVCLCYDYDGSIEGYPFPTLIEITYTIKSKGSLQIQFKVSNKHEQAIPVGIGWHPYLQLGQPVDTLSLKLPVVQHTPVDTRMLPTGLKNDFTEFASLTPIGPRQFDDCFEIQNKGEPSKITLWSDSSKQGFELWQQTGSNAFNFIQICIPPDRQSIAIEPVSCGINAFNTQDGLIELAPGDSFVAECGINCL